MNSREQFEAWAVTCDGNCSEAYGDLARGVDGDYINTLVERDWEVWQAAERQALERAAALIEPKNDMDDWTDWARTRYEAAQQIRGLIDAPSKED